MTRREEAAAKAARFQSALKQSPMVSAAPLSLERSTSASIVGGMEGSTSNRRIDPLTDLWEAMEKNVREAREEKERLEQAKADASKAAQEEADAAAKAQADAAAKARVEEAIKAQADAAAKAQAGAAAGGQAPQLVVPLRSMSSAPEIMSPNGAAGNDQLVMAREGGDVVIPRTEVPQQTSAAETQGSRPNAPPAPQVGGELLAGATPVARTPARRRAVKATSAPRPQEIGASSSSAPAAEATSAVPQEWMFGGGTGVLNKAAQEVTSLLQA
nr:tol-Pal system protein TolA-like [Aegilops tauschii subsp. strangulata]